MGRLIDRLEKRQLVERRPDERDRLSYRLVLMVKKAIERIDKPELKEIPRPFAKKHRSNLPRGYLIDTLNV